MRLHLLFAAPALLLVACPPTSTCPAGQIWNGSTCVAAVDVGPFDGGRDASGEDAPCGGGCTAPLICNVDNNECVACLGTDASSCGAGQNACVDNTCVACDDDADCEALDAAECDTTTNTCVACTDSTACAGRTGTEVCNAGTCVECTTNADCGAMEGCVPETNECRSYVAGGSRLCGDCVADAECPSGQLCIATQYDDPVTVAADPVFAGNRCLWRSDASGPGAPGGACSSVRPYVSTRSLTSVDGVAADVCSLRVSTCEAQDDFSNSAIPCTLDATGNALCGRDGVPDGVCRFLDAGSNRCTVYCVSDDDCRAGVTCDSGRSPGECRL